MSEASGASRSDEVSVSQVNTALDCLRRWGIEKIDGVRSPGHRSARAGQRIHTVLEEWLRSAKPPNLDERLVLDGSEYWPGRSAFYGLHHLPPPGPHLRIEMQFHQRHWNGRVDFWYQAEDGSPVVGDHKTSSNFAYAKNETTLRTDVQAIVYANAALQAPLFRDAKGAYLLWVYYHHRKPYPSRSVRVYLTREEVELAIRPLDVVATGLIQLRRVKGLRSLDLQQNPLSCEKYGGCPYRNTEHCRLTPGQSIRSLYMNNEQSLDEKMALANGAIASVLSAPPFIPVAFPPEGWAVIPGQVGYYYRIGTSDWLTEADLRARCAPAPIPVPIPVPTVPFVIPASPTLDLSMVAPVVVPTVSIPQPTIPVIQVQTPSVSLPPIVALPAQLPVGMINAPESAGLPQRTEPLPETALVVGTQGTQAVLPGTGGPQDDLTLIEDRDVLVKLAQMMGLETKHIKVPGLKDKIRTARAGGAPVIAPVVTQPAVVQNGAAHPQIPQPQNISASFDALVGDYSALDGKRARVTELVAAFISAHANLGDEDMVRRALSINALVEKLTT